jgi:hypothetical protein
LCGWRNIVFLKLCEELERIEKRGKLLQGKNAQC